MKRVLVTGANKGIGRAVVAALLDRHPDVFVYLGCRSPARGTDARNQLAARNQEHLSRTKVVELDVTSERSVCEAERGIREDCEATGTALYGIVNNAGIFSSSAGAAEVLEVNLFGIKRVFDQFYSVLGAQDARVVNVTSASGPNYLSSAEPSVRRVLTDSQATWEDILHIVQLYMKDIESAAIVDQARAASVTYGFSKACANALTVLQARLFPSVAINSCTPGFIDTDLTRQLAAMAGRDPMEMDMKPPSDGVESTLFLLMASEPTITGWYLGSDCKRSPLDSYRAPGDPEFKGH